MPRQPSLPWLTFLVLVMLANLVACIPVSKKHPGNTLLLDVYRDYMDALHQANHTTTRHRKSLPLTLSTKHHGTLTRISSLGYVYHPEIMEIDGQVVSNTACINGIELQSAITVLSQSHASSAPMNIQSWTYGRDKHGNTPPKNGVHPSSSSSPSQFYQVSMGSDCAPDPVDASRFSQPSHTIHTCLVAYFNACEVAALD